MQDQHPGHTLKWERMENGSNDYSRFPEEVLARKEGGAGEEGLTMVAKPSL